MSARGLLAGLLIALATGSDAGDDLATLALPSGPVVTLDTFVGKVLEAHPTARSADLERAVAAAELQAARGGFDPLFRGKVDNKTKDGRDKTDRVDSELEVPVASLFGPRVIAGYKRDVGTSTDPEDRTDGNGEASLGLSVQLLQGIFTDRRRAALSKAKLRPDLSEANRLFERNNLARATATKYWDWAEARELFDVQRRLLDVATARVAQTKGRAAAGEVAPIDAVEAEQEVERRRGETLRALRAFEQNGIDAAALIWSETGTPETLEGIPQPLPRPSAGAERELVQERVQARRLRPEIRRAQLQQEAAKIDVALSRELRRPNVEARVDSIQDDMSAVSGSQYRLGLSISHPLFFRAPDAQLDLARIAEYRADLARRLTERNVEAEVDNALSALTRSLERARAAERETGLAERMEAAERERFAAGETALLVVNLRERATAEARARVVSAKADYLRAIVVYRWAIGTISADVELAPTLGQEPGPPAGGEELDRVDPANDVR